MRSSNPLLALLLVTACAVERPEPQKPGQERPVKVSDAEAEKALGGAKLAKPRLHDESIARDPDSFVDLDAFIKSEKDGNTKVEPNGKDALPQRRSGHAAAEEGAARDGPAHAHP